MKKILFAVVLFTFSFFLLPAQLALAACNPPGDYSDCSITQTGPKIAGNIDPGNYEQIRNEYNKADPSLVNQQIPVTVIYTTADLSPEHVNETTANLRVMQQYGLHPIIRVASSGWGREGWSQITPYEAAVAAGSLNWALSQVVFSQPPVVYFGNEPNLPQEWGGVVDPVSFAQSFATFIQAAGADRVFQIFVPPVAAHQAGAEYNFMQQVLNFTLPDGRTIAQSVDGAALTVYNDSPASLAALYNQLASFYQQNGIYNVVVSELGPLVNGRLLQNREDVDEWIRIMSNVFAELKANPALFGDAQFISTSFFLDLDGDGAPDVTLLVIIDQFGNVIILNLTALGGGYLFGLPGLICQPEAVTDKYSRPAECDPCNETNRLTPGCATTLTVKDEVEYRRGDGSVNPPHCLEKEWGGTVTMDPSQTTIPFVGKKNQESEQKYLADYFEGTNEYYRTYGHYTKDWINYAGVWRKLSPMEYQNKLKERMVKKAKETIASGGVLKEGGLHNYQLDYVGRLCWDTPLIFDALIALAQRVGFPIITPGFRFIAEHSHYCVFDGDILPGGLTPSIFEAAINLFNSFSPIDIYKRRLPSENDRLADLDGHFPPEPEEEDYVEKWSDWKKSEWGKLWEVIPMVSREDTPGYLYPYLGYKSKDQPKTIASQIEKVPHLARLYEISKETQNLLTPQQQGGLLTQANVSSLVASNNQQGQKNQAIIAQANPSNSVCGIEGPISVDDCDHAAVTDLNPNDHLCCQPITIPLRAVDAFENDEYDKCHAEGITCEPPGCTPPPWDPLNPPANPCLSCHNPCDEEVEKEVRRRFGLDLLHPYLRQIWDQATNEESLGLLNIFRPASIPKFQDFDAASQINYSYQDTSDPDEGEVDPETGKFYFPYLGGVQLSKDWVIRALTPWQK